MGIKVRENEVREGNFNLLCLKTKKKICFGKARERKETVLTKNPKVPRDSGERGCQARGRK